MHNTISDDLHGPGNTRELCACSLYDSNPRPRLLPFSDPVQGLNHQQMGNESSIATRIRTLQLRGPQLLCGGKGATRKIDFGERKSSFLQ